MIILFSDFGLHGPYVGQVKAVLNQLAPHQVVIDLFSDAPVFDVRCSAYLLAAYVHYFPEDSVFCAIVDPGVGSEQRQPVIMKAGGRSYVGPDNGLFARVAAMDSGARCWSIDWRPESLSETFHGRDLFAPVAARLGSGQMVDSSPFPEAKSLNTDWPHDYAAVIYIDHFGNAMTGINVGSLADDDKLLLTDSRQGDVTLHYARYYDQVAVGQAFWYRNANGLVEIAINQGHAGRIYGIKPGSPLTIQPSC